MNTTPLPAPVTIVGYEPLHGSAIRGKLALGFGLLLVLLTAGFWYVAWGDLPSEIERPNLPPNLFAGFTFCFFGLPGLMLLFVGVCDVRNDARAQRGAAQHPDEPWRWDYAWTGQQTKDIGLRMAAWGLAGWILGMGIIVPINYIFFHEADFSFVWPALLVLGLFDLLLLLAFGTVLYRVAACLQHGRGLLQFDRFPLRLGEMAELTLQPMSAFDQVEELKCTLRCVQEPCEARRDSRVGPAAGRGTVVTKIGLLRYAIEQTIPGSQLSPGEPVTLHVRLPDAAELQTRLAGLPPTHWELIVSGKRSGIDVQKRFLVPVY